MPTIMKEIFVDDDHDDPGLLAYAACSSPSCPASPGPRAGSCSSLRSLQVTWF